MTSESTSLDPDKDSGESVAAVPAPEEHKAEPVPKTAPPAANAGEPVILLDPDYEAPQMAALPAGHPLEPIASGSILHGSRPAKDGVRVQISQDALEQIRLHSESDMRTELGGFLLGIPYDEHGQMVVDIRAALPAHSNDHGPIHFTFTADSWSLMHEERETLYPHLQVVGWFHTHPDLGVFYSGDDVVVHTVGFSLPWHVGLVVDPIRRQVGWFGWYGEGSRKELDKLAGFYEMTDLQAKAITPWSLVARTAVWASYSESELAYGHSSGYSTTEPVTGSALGGLGAFLGAVGILMALLVWTLGYLPARRELNELKQTVIVMSEAELVSAEAQGLASCDSDGLLFLAPAPGDWVPAGSTIPVHVVADIAGASGYRLVQTTQVGLAQRSQDIGYYERFAFAGQLTDYQVPALPFGTPLELELVPVTSLTNSDFCAITIFVGQP